jgi:hypothetical protein
MTTYAQTYCTLAQLVEDLKLNGDEPQLFSRIQAASRFIQRRFGNFIPITGAKTYGVRMLHADVQIDPCLAVTAITNDGTAVTDYVMKPDNRHWDNGPYTRIYSESVGWDEDDIDVTGRWGKYEETEAVAVSAITQATASETTLVVSNGSLISQGMALLIGSEQELVTGYGAVTLATSQLNGAIAAADEEITVDNGAEFKEGEVILLSTEDVYIRKIRGNVLVCARGYNGTTKASHLTDLAISVYRTYAVTRGANGTTAAIHTTAAVSKYVVPDDINWLCRQIAGLMRMKAASGFAGKVGNAELGETTYYKEFPTEIKDIERNYRIVQL